MDAGKVTVRRFPYPYRAMLAICSDLDETPDRHVYREIMRFLNTTQETAMGRGVGLEVGNTIYFDMPAGQFAYWNTDDAGREMVRALIRSGHIDCLHSYGDLAATRQHVEVALDELTRHDCRLEVWVDHGTAPTNFGEDIMEGHGAEIGHPAYHADLTMAYGIRYVWRGRVTSIIGQDVPVSLGGIWTLGHPVASTRTVAKEAAKRVLGARGSAKYDMHCGNRLLRPMALSDGTPSCEFIRCNPHWGGVSSCDTGREIGQVLTGRMLRRLVKREGVCILYTHLGKVGDPRVPFDASAVAGFRRLAEAGRRGLILIATTRRLLGHRRAVHEVEVAASEDARGRWIDIRTPAADASHAGPLRREDLSGLTIYVREPDDVRIRVDGEEVRDIERNAPDDTGRPSVSLPWKGLDFPDV